MLLDGAMGTRLIAAGVAPEQVWRAPLDHPELVTDVHRSYAMADAVTAATFGLSMHADHPDAPAVARAALKLAREVAGERRVIASLGPGEPAKVTRCLGDADVLLLETFTRLDALQDALVRCAFEGERWATLAFPSGEQTIDGAAPEDARQLPADAIGVNCGTRLDAARLAIRMVGDTRVIAQPGVSQPVSAEEFADLARDLSEAGVWAIGGCCGIGPEHLLAATRS